jgi:hypothetical protein
MCCWFNKTFTVALSSVADLRLGTTVRNLVFFFSFLFVLSMSLLSFSSFFLVFLSLSSCSFFLSLLVFSSIVKLQLTALCALPPIAERLSLASGTSVVVLAALDLSLAFWPPTRKRSTTFEERNPGESAASTRPPTTDAELRVGFPELGLLPVPPTA